MSNYDPTSGLKRSHRILLLTAISLLIVIAGLYKFFRKSPSVTKLPPESVLGTPESDHRTFESYFRTPESDLRTPKSILPTPESDLRTPKSILSTPESDLRTPKSILPTPEFNLPTPKSDLRTPEQFLHERLSQAEAVWAEQLIKLRNYPKSGVDTASIVWGYYYPTFTCPYLVERIGKVDDGGKWTCGLSEISRPRTSLLQDGQLGSRPCTVYSYGVAGDTSFEEEILRRTNCTLRGFDHTISNMNGVRANMDRKYPNRTTFQQIGIGAKDEGQLRTLRTAMKENGDEFIDILKMDVEGAEAAVLPQMFQDFNGTFPFGQLLIEIHLGFGLKTQVAMKEWWEILEKGGLRPFSKEPNLGPSDFCCFELAFLNVKVGHFALKDPPV